MGDAETAADVAQDAFVATHGAWRLLRDPGNALSHLRRCVVNGSGSALRQRTAERNATESATEKPGTGAAADTPLERSAVIAALQMLPPRQREAIVLGFYLDLPEEQVAAAMGVSRGSVRRHTARAMAVLPSVLKLQK